MIHHTDDMPAELRVRPRDHRGFPVPWFVTRKDERGRWDFVTVDTQRMYQAIRQDLCWVTGEPLGRFRSFVIGPMCVINRVAGDPPVKRNVALYSATVCPFLVNPRMRRVGEHGEIMEGQRGRAVSRNPGLCAVFTVEKKRQHFNRHSLFDLGEPSNVEWFKEGRPATRQEARAALDDGFAFLLDEAEKEGDNAVMHLLVMYELATRYLPVDNSAPR